MSSARFTRWYAGCLSLWAAGMALPARAQLDTFGGDPSTSALIRIPANTDDWTRHFRLGALAGLNLKAKFGTSGNNFGISGNHPANGVFDDGYILKDASGDPTCTANWGYNSASQLSGNALTMHATSAFSTAGGGEADGGFQPGLDLAYGGNLFYWKHARVGWEMGFGWLPVNISATQSQTAAITQSTYTFSTGSIQVPQPPYQGEPSGNGPFIPYPSASGFNPTTTSTTTGTITGTRTLDEDLYTLRLGPSIYWDLTERTSLSFGAGPAIGLVDGTYAYSETIVVNGVSSLNHGRLADTQFTYGAYVNAAFMYHLVANGDLYLGVQYLPMENVTISGGGRSGQLDLSGQLYLSVGINWPF